MVAHAFDPSTGEAEAGVSLSSRPAWSTEPVPGVMRPSLKRERKNKSRDNSAQLAIIVISYCMVMFNLEAVNFNLSFR